MAEICEKHGYLKRSCFICDYENEIKELNDKLDKVHSILLNAREACNNDNNFVVKCKICEAITKIKEE